MPYLEGIRLINRIYEKRNEEILYERWLTLYPHMELQRIKFISFNKYKNIFTKLTKKSNKTNEELILQAEKIKMIDLKQQKEV